MQSPIPYIIIIIYYYTIYTNPDIHKGILKYTFYSIIYNCCHLSNMARTPFDIYVHMNSGSLLLPYSILK